jgi:hypothetical protein
MGLYGLRKLGFSVFSHGDTIHAFYQENPQIITIFNNAQEKKEREI